MEASNVIAQARETDTDRHRDTQTETQSKINESTKSHIPRTIIMKPKTKY